MGKLKRVYNFLTGRGRYTNYSKDLRKEEQTARLKDVGSLVQARQADPPPQVSARELRLVTIVQA